MVAKSAGATASSSEAAAAGERLLRLGGNAVDAAVATAIASCVTDPCNTGIGGLGGHMIVAAPGRSPICIDFNVWAPLDALNTYRGEQRTGSAATSVIPNVIAGLSVALRDFGTKSWADVLEPAIVLADEGFICGTTLRRAFDDVKNASFVSECFSFEAVGNDLRIRQPALAQTLRKLASGGPQWFYEGPVAAIGSRCLTEAGHSTTPSTWADGLNVVTVTPAPSIRLGAFSIFSSPLCTSGSICMFASLAAGHALASTSDLDSPAVICRWAELMAASWSYRFGTTHGNSIENGEIDEWITCSAAFEDSVMLTGDTGHTCHLNAVDKSGMMAATTLTHGMLWFGSRWVLPGSGIIMNYGAPALTNLTPKHIGQRGYGITNMSPTIVRCDDGAIIAIGSPGARRIASIIGVTLARHLFGSLPLQRAIEHGRFHAEDRNRATLELDRFPATVSTALKRKFNAVESEQLANYYGPCTAIRRDRDGTLILGLDNRWPGFGILVA